MSGNKIDYTLLLLVLTSLLAPGEYGSNFKSLISENML